MAEAPRATTPTSTTNHALPNTTASEDNHSGTGAAEGGRHDQSGLMRRVQRAGTEFAELIERNPAVDYADEFANVPDFSTLLNG